MDTNTILSNHHCIDDIDCSIVINIADLQVDFYI